jgi:hypothetical protein
VNDSWSSEEATAEQRPADDGREPPVTTRRSDRHDAPGPAADPAGRRERHPWVGLVLLLAGLGAGGAGLATIALELDRPGVLEVAPERWWLVVGGGLAIAWSAPWFLRPRGRARMAIALGVCTAAVLAVAAVAIGGVGS